MPRDPVSPRSLFVFSLLTLCLTLPLAGQGIPEKGANGGLPAAAPADVGLSAERLARITGAVRDHIDAGELAGAVALVARRGKVAHFEALGRMDGEAGSGVPMPGDALFGIASMTKPITSTAVMMLYEEDRFQLDDPVSRYLPALEKMTVIVVEEGHEGPEAPYTTVPAERQTTIRDLLRHTSGLTYDFMDPGPVGRLYREQLEPDETATLGDFVTKLAELPLARQPATGFGYGLSTDVLGYLVEVVSGEPFDRFLARRIFAPLGMHDTAFYVPADKVERMTTLYAAGEDGKVKPAVRPWFRGYREPPAMPSGGAGLVSTATDYARFLQMLLGGGRANGVRLLSRKSVELMTTGHLGAMREGFYPGYDFGLGFAVRVDVGESGTLGSVGEYAWSGIFSTYFFVDPHEQMFAILMTQTSPFDGLDLGSRFKKLVYQAIDD